MNISIDVSPLESGHKVRGTGFYLHHLKDTLLRYYPDNNYNFFISSGNNNKSDIVHYPYFEPFQITLPYHKTTKTVVTVHDLIPLVYPHQFPAGIKGLFKWKVQKAMLRNTDAIITDSEASKRDIVRITGIDAVRIHVVYLAAGDEFNVMEKDGRKKEIMRKYSLPERFVLYVGDVTWNKNLPNLIAAIKKLNITLVLAGKALSEDVYDSYNPWNNDLVKVRKQTQNDNRFIRLGYVPQEDLVSLYQCATLLAMPSIYEGFGLPVIEAMQSGCPVVTTKAGSLWEVAGEAALFVNPMDIESITDGIGKVYFSDSMQNKLSKKGISQAKKFSWKKTAKETIAVYNQVLIDIKK